jgi:hypothetical protein
MVVVLVVSEYRRVAIERKTAVPNAIILVLECLNTDAVIYVRVVDARATLEHHAE